MAFHLGTPPCSQAVDRHVPMTVLALGGRTPPREWSVFYVHHVLKAADLAHHDAPPEYARSRPVWREILRRGTPTGTTAQAARTVLTVFRLIEMAENLVAALFGLGEGYSDRCSRGEVYLHLGRYDAARDAFDAARAMRPFEATAHGGLGKAHTFLGDLAEAERHFTSAVHLSDEVTRLRSRADLAEILFRLGRRDEGLAELRTHLREMECQARAGPFHPWLRGAEGRFDGLLALAAADAGLAEEAERTRAVVRGPPDRLGSV